jgi:flavin prenyltransferase
VIAQELPDRADPRTVFRFEGPARPRVFPEDAIDAPFSSGSFRTGGVAIVPASMGTVGAIAAGAGANAIHRAADVALKERRTLVLVPRETPLSAIHLENLLRLARAGAIILPASPGFYHAPASVSDQVDFIVSRILDHLGIENDLVRRWTGGGDAPRS